MAKDKDTHVCSNCRYWKNEQAELDYVKDYGFCVNPALEYNTATGRKIGLKDRGNVSTKLMGVQEFELLKKNSHLDVTRSRYLFVTSDVFGCNFIEPK